MSLKERGYLYVLHTKVVFSHFWEGNFGISSQKNETTVFKVLCISLRGEKKSTGLYKDLILHMK